MLVTYVTPMATLPVTAADLDASAGVQPWILSAMSIGLAGVLLASGLLGDRIGRRRTYAYGLCAVTLGAVLCAVSQDAWLFVGARVFQGAGGAAVLACGLAILAHSYPPGPERIHATSVWAASIGAGIAGGSLLAVALDIGTQWRENYVVTALAGALLLMPTLRRLPESRANVPRRFDVVGLALLITGIVALVSALTQARNGASPTVFGLVGLALFALVALVLVKRRVPQPLIELELLRHPRFLGTTLGALVNGIGMVGMASFLPTVAQSGFGDSLRVASIPPLVWALVSVVSALAFRRLPLPLHGPLPIAALLALTAAVMLTALGADSTLWLLVPMTLAGVTSGFLNALLGREAIASVPADRAAMGSGANNTARYLGAACGITLFAVIATDTGSDITEGWNNAVLTAAAITLLGAATIAALAAIRPSGPTGR